MRGLIERDQAASRYALTEQGRAMLAALLEGERWRKEGGMLSGANRKACGCREPFSV
jgi:hypothetical protein